MKTQQEIEQKICEVYNECGERDGRDVCQGCKGLIFGLFFCIDERNDLAEQTKEILLNCII